MSASEYHSYNLHYFGEIKNITAKTITGRGSARRLTIDAFASRNGSDLASKHDRNADTMLYI